MSVEGPWHGASPVTGGNANCCYGAALERVGTRYAGLVTAAVAVTFEVSAANRAVAWGYSTHSLGFMVWV